jgi:hypothetical protein
MSRNPNRKAYWIHINKLARELVQYTAYTFSFDSDPTPSGISELFAKLDSNLPDGGLGEASALP